jgi:DNA-binding NtrC family response regulator
MSSKAKILVIDDELIVLKSCDRILSEEGYDVQTVQTGTEGLQRLTVEQPDIVLTDLKMPDISGMEVLERIIESYPGIIVIMITGYSTVQTAVEAMKLGAYDYVPKPFTPEELVEAVNRALDKKKQDDKSIYPRVRESEVRDGLHNLLGKSEKMQEVYRMIKKVAPTNATVVIYGESGTGKEVVARAIHYDSERRDRRFVAADCSALPPSILESELFGHVRGSFTGATDTRPGLFEVADGGTLFLDEISNISLEIQGKLLRVLEEREFKPVGSSEIRKVDVRFVAATNRDLKAMVAEGSFREDLYYRLNVFPITVPPLRERREDIPLFAYYFLDQLGREVKKEIKGFSADAMDLLMQYHWPGNVRELKNVIERLVIMSDEELLGRKHVRGTMKDSDVDIAGRDERAPRTKDELKEAKKRIREEASEDIERAFVIQALSRNDWNVTKAAQDTGMQRSNFQALMRKHGIRLKDLRPK